MRVFDIMQGHTVVGHCELTQEMADQLNNMPGAQLYFRPSRVQPDEEAALIEYEERMRQEAYEEMAYNAF